jgi:hypothetical protein
MIQCRKCGKEIGENSKFCIFCGTPIVADEQPIEQPIMMQQTQPTMQQAQPIMQQTQPTMQQSQPIMQQTQPTMQQSQPTMQQTQPTMQQMQPGQMPYNNYGYNNVPNGKSKNKTALVVAIAVILCVFALAGAFVVCVKSGIITVNAASKGEIETDTEVEETDTDEEESETGESETESVEESSVEETDEAVAEQGNYRITTAIGTEYGAPNAGYVVLSGSWSVISDEENDSFYQLYNYRKGIIVTLYKYDSSSDILSDTDLDLSMGYDKYMQVAELVLYFFHSEIASELDIDDVTINDPEEFTLGNGDHGYQTFNVGESTTLDGTVMTYTAMGVSRSTMDLYGINVTCINSEYEDDYIDCISEVIDTYSVY